MIVEMILDIETFANPAIVEKFRSHAERLEIDPVKFVATSPWLCEIVAIGWQFEGHRGVLVNRSPFPEPHRNATAITDAFNLQSFVSENGMLGFFAEKCRLLTQEHWFSFVTFAGRSFDLPTIFHRGIANDVENLAVAEAANEYRFKPNRNIDLQDRDMTFFGATCKKPSLREVCVGYGLGDPKQNGDGGDVQRLVDEGRVLDLATYCMGDVEYTRKLYEKLYPPREASNLF